MIKKEMKTQQLQKQSSNPLCKKCPHSELFWLAFPAFGLNTERYSVSVLLRNAGKCGKNADQNNSECRQFLRSALQCQISCESPVLRNSFLCFKHLETIKYLNTIKHILTPVFKRLHVFCISNTFISNTRPDIGKKISKS